MMSTRILSSSVSPPVGQKSRKSPFIHSQVSNPHITSPTPLTHIVLAGDVAQDGIALGEPVLTVQEIGQLEGKGQAK